ncbi:unnamed protein product, partial [Rotaria sp. Silwood1]
MEWFGERPLCNEIKQIAEGSYQKPGGYEDGIRGKGYIVNALEAALWAFWSDGNSFERGALAAVNLGDDTDTTAAIYGQLAGAYYGYKKLPRSWVKQVYARKFILNLSSWIAYEGEMWRPSDTSSSNMSSWPYALYSDATSTKIAKHDLTLNLTHPRRDAATTITQSTEYNETASAEKYENPTKLRKTQSAHFTKPSSSPIISPKKKETPKHYNMAVHFTSEPEFEEVIIGEPLDRPRLNAYPLITEELVHPDNTIHYSGKTPSDNNQHNLPLRYTQPITNKDEYDSLVRTTLNQRISNHDNKNSKLLVERRPSDKHVESSGKTSFSSRAGPRHPAPTKHSKVNKHDDLIESEPNYTSQDMLSFSQPPLRTLKGSSPKSSTSQSGIPKTHAREQPLDRPMPVLDDNQCLSWSCDEVCAWIQSWGEIYSTYIDGFKRYNVNGYRLLHFVDNEALWEFGVESLFNRRVILNGIENLQKRCGIQLSSRISSLNDFANEFDGDFVPSLYLSDNTYPNTMSCILQPLQNNIHSKLYNRILKWLGSLPNDIDIDKIELIHNAELHRMFLQQIKRTERRQKQQEFQPNLNAESNPIERKKVLNR